MVNFLLLQCTWSGSVALQASKIIFYGSEIKRERGRGKERERERERERALVLRLVTYID